jgi:hypothetical protein
MGAFGIYHTHSFPAPQQQTPRGRWAL